MNLSDCVADLHLHTTASDGTASVAERVEHARERGLSTIAITDHDCIAATLDRRAATRDGVAVVTGVEVRADVHGTKVEILGYYVDPTDENLRSMLERARRYRRDRNEAMVARLREETAATLDVEALRASTDGSVGRPLLADELIDQGVVDSIGEAFDEYLGDDGSAFVPMERIPFDEVVSTVQGAGGVASLAHPGRIRSQRVPDLVSTLSAGGLDAIEVRYPYGTVRSDEYADVGVEEAAELAAEYDLLETGGSDCHGPDSGKFRIGSVRVTESTLDSIRSLADEREPLDVKR
jgi:predicted metal-dependent phosphoesterase TrpH